LHRPYRTLFFSFPTQGYGRFAASTLGCVALSALVSLSLTRMPLGTLLQQIPEL
jgi:hypothetical protein